MALDHQQRHLQTIRSFLSLAVVPVQYSVKIPETLYGHVQENLQQRESLLADNQALIEENLLLKTKLLRFDALQKENERLTNLLKSPLRANDRILVAKLLQVDPDPFSHRVVLNKGSQQGVYEGQPVFDAQGVVGQVIKVGPISCIVLLITDISHAIPVQSNRSGARSIAVGTGALDILELSHVTNTADLQMGDLLVTSGLGNRFPEGYPVGRIVSMERDPGQPFIRVKVTPAAHLDKTREVLLVWPDVKREGNAL